MGKFNRGGDRGGDRFGGRGRDRSERPAMHQAICAECGRECEVPFRPSGDKPVYCSDCFSRKDGGDNNRGGNNRFERRSSSRPSFGDKQMFAAVCDQCHKPCEVPFKPSSDKPIYCNDCFGKGERSGGSKAGGSNSDQTKKQFEMLSNKLDTIIKLLSPKGSIEKPVKEEKMIVKTEKKLEKPIEVKKVVAVKKVAAPKKVVKKEVVKKKKK